MIHPVPVLPIEIHIGQAVVLFVRDVSYGGLKALIGAHGDFRQQRLTGKIPLTVFENNIIFGFECVGPDLYGIHVLGQHHRRKVGTVERISTYGFQLTVEGDLLQWRILEGHDLDFCQIFGSHYFLRSIGIIFESGTVEFRDVVRDTFVLYRVGHRERIARTIVSVKPHSGLARNLVLVTFILEIRIYFGTIGLIRPQGRNEHEAQRQ